MERLGIALVVISLGFTVPAAGQATGAPAAKNEAQEHEITLNQEQKQAVIDAVVSAKSRQKTPKEFSARIGAIVPKEVYLHGFKPDEIQKTPLLKEYLYAFLDQEVVLVAGEKNTIVSVVALPGNLVAGEQTHQGAAEASSTNAKGATSPTGSVPSHTSPESIK